MNVKFICMNEGWSRPYSVAFLPRLEEDVIFPEKTGQYVVTAVKHEVVKINNARRDTPDVRVYVRSREANKNYSRLVKDKAGALCISGSAPVGSLQQAILRSKEIKEAKRKVKENV